MREIAYGNLPEVPPFLADRHGVFQNPYNFTVEVWIQGKLEITLDVSVYMRFGYEVLYDAWRELMHRRGLITPWQIVLLKQILYPWLGDNLWLG